MLRVLTLSLLLVGSAVAQEAPDGLASKVAEQAYECWNLLPSDYSSENIVVLDVELDAEAKPVGFADIVKEPRNNTAVARAAQRAVLSCGPYKFKDFNYIGIVRITLVPKTE